MEGDNSKKKKRLRGRGPLLKGLRMRVLMEESKKPWAEEKATSAAFGLELVAWEEFNSFC